MVEAARKQDIENTTKAIEAQMSRQEVLAEQLRSANEQRFAAGDAVPASQLVGLNSIQKQILDIQEKARVAAQNAAKAFAEGFGEINTTADAQEFADGLDKIAVAYKGVADAQTAVAQASYDSSRLFDTGWKDAFTKFKEDAMDSGRQAADSFNNFTSSMEDAFVKFVQGGKLSFKDLANSILADLARIAFKKAVIGMASLFGFAAGGQVMADTPIIVGERGPELFVPRSAGAIVPNNALGGMAGRSNEGGGAVTVNYNIQAVDAASFRSLVARDPSFIYAVTEQGRRSQPSRSR